MTHTAEADLTVIYHGENLPEPRTHCIYLAGPTNFPASQEHWHTAALAILRSLGYAGAVILPMPRDGRWRGDERNQIRWQIRAQARADVIVFWVPRLAPGTYLEFGDWLNKAPRKLILGLPDSDHAGLIVYYAAEANILRVRTLGALLGHAVKRLKH